MTATSASGPLPLTAVNATVGTAALLDLVRDGRPRTRAELSAETGLARSTIAERVDLLMNSGLLRHAEKGRSTGGRPPSLFAFNPEARVVLVADVGATHVKLAVTDLAGQVLVEDDEAIDIGRGPEVVLGHLQDRGLELLTALGRSPGELLGIGIGLPGPVEFSSGRPTNPPIMPGWDGFDVPGFVRSRIDAVTLVDNDVNIMALGEHRTNWPDESQFILVKVATGIGSGLVIDGRLHRGAQGVAGDMGHVRLPHDADVADVMCRCGNIGCLESVASGAAVAARLTEQGVAARGSAEVVALARSGSVPTLRLVRQAGRDIGEVLATAVSLINPSVVVIGGALAQAGEHLIAGVREVVYQRSLPLATEHLRIVQAGPDGHAGIQGAAFMVIEHALAPSQLDALLTA